MKAAIAVIALLALSACVTNQERFLDTAKKYGCDKVVKFTEQRDIGLKSVECSK